MVTFTSVPVYRDDRNVYLCTYDSVTIVKRNTLLYSRYFGKNKIFVFLPTKREWECTVRTRCGEQRGKIFTISAKLALYLITKKKRTYL